MVVTVEPHATDIGVDVLKAGGNAIDAAVAKFALAVTHPSAESRRWWLSGPFRGWPDTFLDFPQARPGSASRDMYLVHPESPLMTVVG
jgi:gamma-glutamyltranspeptidase/glutathione hydrolase